MILSHTTTYFDEGSGNEQERSSDQISKLSAHNYSLY
jgi:hypothetical protein